MNRHFSIPILILSLLLTLSKIEAKNLQVDFADFDPFQETLSKVFVEQKIKKALQKDPEIENWYAITNDAFKMYASFEDKKEDRAEFILHFGPKKPPQKKLPQKKDPGFPLLGYRIAIDPGHIGGTFARLEEKYIHMPIQPEKGIFEEIEFNEGELAQLTAHSLKERLEALGATIFLTKQESGQSSLDQNFYRWFDESFDDAVASLVSRQPDSTLQKKEASWWKNEASLTEIFRSTYNYLDLQKRAELINTFNPHVTITCHYNLGGSYDAKGYTKGTHQNYTLFFVAGAFEKGDTLNEFFRRASLKSAQSRYEFIRLLVTQDLEESVRLSLFAQKRVQEMLQVPIGTWSSLKVTYPEEAPGIYHRNLMLPRLVHSPILYAEPLCQDNYEQVRLFHEKPLQCIEQMVEVYTKALLDWTNSQEP